MPISDSRRHPARLHGLEGRLFCFEVGSDARRPDAVGHSSALRSLVTRLPSSNELAPSSPGGMEFSGSVHSRMNVVSNYIHLSPRPSGRSEG